MFDSLFLKSAAALVIIDSIFLYAMKDHFNKQVKLIQGSPLKLNMWGALITYIFLVVGLYYFIIKPKRTVKDAFLFGIIMYGVFEGTNIAIFSKWSWITFLMDTLWGGILCALTTYIVQQ